MCPGKESHLGDTSSSFKFLKAFILILKIDLNYILPDTKNNKETKE